ncbi:hypothetical protein ABLE94_05850 [Gordonia sp. VNK1]|uniref:hypothetical protein n=1 Tax=Gordonia oleivorans TaxID=3156618 RepID=UPI0032B5BA7E
MRGSPDAQIAGHRLAEIVGQGGMGTVYAAHHPRLPRMVALKVPNASVSADPAFRRRFQREAHLSAGLEHPHIVGCLREGVRRRCLSTCVESAMCRKPRTRRAR